MPYPWSQRIEGLLAKIESVYGSDPTPVAASDGVRGVGRVWGALSHEWAFPNMREDVVSNSLVGVAPGTPKGRVVNIDYTVQLMGAGAAYDSGTPVRPECDPLLMACGLARTHDDSVGSELIDYDLADTGHSGVTIYAYGGGKEFKITHCRGNLTWNPQAGGLGEIQFQIQGLLQAVAEASVPSITYDSTKPPPAVSMGLALVPSGGSSWTPRTAGVEITTGHEIGRLDDVNSADGIEGFFLSRTDPRFTMQARADDLSNYPAYARAADRTVHTIDLTLGSTQYNRVKLDVELGYLVGDPQPAEEEGFSAWQLEYQLRDLQLTFD